MASRLRALSIVHEEPSITAPRTTAAHHDQPTAALSTKAAELPSPKINDDGDASTCDLLFAIPTVARPNANTNYLNVTLEALLCQLPPVSATPRVCIGVFEPRRPPPSAYTDSIAQPTPFELARIALAARPEVRSRVMFIRPPAIESAEATGAFAAAERAAGGAAVGSKAVPRLGATKRQTVDVARMLLALEGHTAEHLVLMEDDWLLCDGGMDALLYLLAKASIYRPDWAALRFSYGLNGILLRRDDLSAFASFLLNPAADADNNLPDAPVDHLAYRWLRGKYRRGRAYFGTRRIVAFRHSLYWHVGDASAIGNINTRHKPKCYAPNREWLFEQELFHEDECPDDDVWPCTPRPSKGSSAARPLEELVAATAARAPGAEVCDGHRLCWGRPAGERTRLLGDGGRKCSSRLQCASGRSTPCVPTLPEYAAR